MASNKKIDFLIKQGFDKDVVDLFINCGVDKNLLWFLGAHKKGAIKYLNAEEIRMVNKYLESTKNVSKLSYQEIRERAHAFEQNEDRKNKNKIYKFDNGFYISILNDKDLKEEGQVMANCVGSYESRVKYGEVGILALKQPSGKTVAHIEIRRNGLIGQNYAKANTQMSKESWSMILEFFEKNSKNVNLSDLFGESYVVVNNSAYINEISLSVPTSVNVVLRNGAKEIVQNDGFEVKRFLSFNKHKETYSKISKKSDIVNWIEERKQEIIKLYDELSSQVIATSASKLYLSDEMKEKIFGDHKGAYLLKGENYNVSEIDPRYGQEEKVAEGMADEIAMPVPDMNVEERREEVAIRRRPIIRLRNAGQQVAEGAVNNPEPGEAEIELQVAVHEPGEARDVDEVQERLEAVIDAINEAVGEEEVIEHENVEIRPDILAVDDNTENDNAENQADRALVEDINGNFYEVNLNEAEEVDMAVEIAGEEGGEAFEEPMDAGEEDEGPAPMNEEGFMPRDFNQMLRKAK